MKVSCFTFGGRLSFARYKPGLHRVSEREAELWAAAPPELG